MAKDYSNLEGLIGNVKESIKNAYDKGYKQGFNEGQAHQLASDDVFRESCEKSAYEKGLNDAWECVRKIMLSDEDGGIAHIDIQKIFGGSYYQALMNYSASEAIAKIKEYEEKQKQADDEIKVGDEVGNEGGKYIITKILSYHYANVMATNGGMAYIDPTRYKKTGRHFDQIAEVLEQLKEEQDETK